MSKISILIPTARPTFGAYSDYHGHKGFDDTVHLFEPFKETLAPQLLDEVELVIADNLGDHRNLCRFFSDTPKINVKVIQQESKWHRFGCYSHADMYNDMIEASTGDYLVLLADCLSFPEGFMDLLYQKAEAGTIAQIMFYEKVGDLLLPKDEAPETWTDAFDTGVDWRQVSKGDPRWELQWGGRQTFDTFREIYWGQCFGFYGIPRDVMYRFNGLDQNFDGQKDQNDIELFSRMQFYNADMPIQLDRKLWVYHHQHKGLLANTGDRELGPTKTIRSNLDMMFFHRGKGVTRANCTVYGRDDVMKVARGEFLGYPGQLEAGARRLKENPDLVEEWVKHQPLRELE